MTSVNTNAAATTALRTLQMTNKSLETTQSRVSTGLKIGEAKDNAAYWAISTTLKSDNKSLSTVKDALGLGAATVDTAYQGLNKAKEVLDEIKSKLTAATQAGVDKNVIQSEIAELQKQLASIAGSSVFSGENWLSVDSGMTGFNAQKQVVSSFARDASNTVTIGTINIDITGVALFDANADTTKSGILDSATSLKGANGRDLAYGGAPMDGNKSVGGIAAVTSTGTDAGKAKTVFTGSFAATTLDSNDKLTFAFKVDGVASSIEIKAGDVSGTGIATAGTIGSVDELAVAVNNVLKANGITAVTAVKDGSSFALQRADGGLNRTVEVTGFTGSDAAFGVSTLAFAGATADVAGAAYTAEAQTFTIGGTASADGTLTFALATGETIDLTIDFTGGMDTPTEIAEALEALIEADTTLNALVEINNVAGAVTLTYKTPGDKGLAVVTPNAAGVTVGVAVAQSVAYAANGANDKLVYSTGTTLAFADADDTAILKFSDSLVGGGAIQSVSIKKADLEAAGITDGLLNTPADIRAALTASFQRQAATTPLFGNYTVSGSGNDIIVTRNGPGVVGQTITITNSLTFLDPSAAIENEFGLTAAAGIKRGTNATEAAASNTVSLPSAGIVLDTDDSIAFDVMVGTGAAKTVVIDKALVDATLATATKAKVTAGAFDAYGLTASDVISFDVKWDGVVSTYAVTGLTSTSTASDFATAINTATAIAGATGTFASKGTASVENGKLVFSALTTGSSKSVEVANVSNTNAYAGSGGLAASGVVYGESAVTAGGTISNPSQFARVVDAALSAAGVSGVTAAISGGKLALSSTNVGATASVAVSNVQGSSGANKMSIDKIDISNAGFAAVNVASAEEVKATLTAYISVVNAAINKITTAASNLGAVSSRIDLQQSFVDTLIDTIDEGVGNLIDSDLTEESTRLQALQTKQQLGIQALSIANSSTQNILALFQ